MVKRSFLQGGVQNCERVAQFGINLQFVTPWWEPLRPIGPDLLIKALAGGSRKGALRFGHVQILNSTVHSKVGVLHDTFDIFVILAAHRRSQWQYLVVRRAVFSERVVIFGVVADRAWI